MSIISKMGNVKLLKKKPHTSASIPVTRFLSFSSLRAMLLRFPSVYLKPNDCCHGKGIIRVDRLPKGRFKMRIRDTKRTSHRANLSKVWSLFQRVRMNRYYVVQQGIESVTKKGVPFDIRAHVLRVDGEWKVAGLVGRVARSKSIVTNRHSGGKPRFIDHLLTKDLGYSPEEKEKVIQTMENLAKQSAETISRAYPRWYELGVDLGIDRQRHVWIYEVNITPGFTSFSQVDPEARQRILSWRKKAK